MTSYLLTGPVSSRCRLRRPISNRSRIDSSRNGPTPSTDPTVARVPVKLSGCLNLRQAMWMEAVLHTELESRVETAGPSLRLAGDA